MFCLEDASTLGIVVILLNELGLEFLAGKSDGNQIFRFVDYGAGAFVLFSFVETNPGGPFLRSDIAGDGPGYRGIRVVSMVVRCVTLQFNVAIFLYFVILCKKGQEVIQNTLPKSNNCIKKLVRNRWGSEG
jgi:hypothetical protein